MSVECLVSREQLRGLSYDTAKLYGMPHIGCRYYREDVNCYEWTDEVTPCAVCGKVGRRDHSRHHEPPKSKGSFLLETPWGKFVILPALIHLCGSGNTGCHGDRHTRRLEISWEWDSDEFERMWWSGEFLKSGYQPNGEWLFDYGRYVFEKDGLTKEFRRMADAQWGRWK